MLKPLAPLWRWPRSHPKTCILIVLALGGVMAGVGVWRWRAGQLPAAERALRAGRFTEAREHLRRCLSWSIGDPDVLCLAARLERVEGNFDAADTYLEQCQTRNGTTPLGTLEAALLRAQRGDLSEERLLLRLADDQTPQAPWILEALARAHLSAFRFSRAIHLLNAWLMMQPACARALEWRGLALEQKHVLSEAVKTYEKLLNLDPRRWQARVRLVGIYLEANRLQEASPHLDVLERDHAEEPDACVLLGQRDVMKDRLGQARRHFEAALRADPKNARAMLQLGKLELQLDRPKEAEELLSRAHQAFPYDTHIHHALAECYERLPGQKDKAEFHRQRFQTIRQHSRQIDVILAEKLPAAPSDPEVLTELGRHYFAVGQDRLGEQWLQNALRVNPGYRPAHASLAEFYERAGEAEKAAHHRTLANQGRPRDGKSPVLIPAP